MIFSQRGNAQEAESLGAKLQMSEELLREERVKVRVLEDKMRQMELDIEAIPILKAQVWIWQTSFLFKTLSTPAITNIRLRFIRLTLMLSALLGKKSLVTKQIWKSNYARSKLNPILIKWVILVQQSVSSLIFDSFAFIWQNDALPIGLTNVRDRVNHMDEAQGARQR